MTDSTEKKMVSLFLGDYDDLLLLTKVLMVQARLCHLSESCVPSLLCILLVRSHTL
jgi:hypothetical protein